MLPTIKILVDVTVIRVDWRWWRLRHLT